MNTGGKGEEMKVTTTVLGSIAVLILTFSIDGVTAQDETKGVVTAKQLQKLYSEYLSTEGYRPKVDGDGDVQFKREGRTYFIDVTARDPEFFRVVLANVWSIENEAERSKVLVAADYSNAKSKVSKVATVGDNVWVSTEVFVASPEDFTGIFKRLMSALDHGVTKFALKMRELRESERQ